MQFVESECEVLPSKERCPYLVVAEMIEQPFTSKSEEIYTQGAYVRVCVCVCGCIVDRMIVALVASAIRGRRPSFSPL